MFCQNCGEKLESQNQKFCASCGSVISNTTDAPQAPQLKAEQYQAPSKVWPVPDYESKPIEVGEPGPHSKRSLAFAIVSLALAAVGFGFGISSNFIGMIMPYSPYPGISTGVFGLIIGVIFNITGLIFGILSRKNCSNARNFEPINTLKKVGGVFAVFGIVINIIPLAIIFIILVLPILVVLFIFF